MKQKLKILCVLFFCTICVRLRAQDVLARNSNFGINVGVNFAVGSHFQRFGLNLNFFAFAGKHVQFNSEIRAYMNFKNLGPTIIHPELVLSQGIVFAYGPTQNFVSPFINSVSNQSGLKNSVGYSYNAFFNKIKTKQQTGIISLQFSSVTFLIENDLLAKPLLDRFRTGAFLLQYQYKDVYQAAINCTMWTGAMGKMIKDNSHCPANCYMDTTNGTYTKYSHGLLSAQLRYNIGLAQNVQLNVGMDAEEVRHAVQNRVIHDLIFLPKKWPVRINCHIPMLDENGDQYLWKEGQKIRKKKLYWNVFSNANHFY